MRRQEKAANWSRRYKLNVERLASGDLDRVRQAVVELERREQDTGLTPGRETPAGQGTRHSAAPGRWVEPLVPSARGITEERRQVAAGFSRRWRGSPRTL